MRPLSSVFLVARLAGRRRLQRLERPARRHRRERRAHRHLVGPGRHPGHHAERLFRGGQPPGPHRSQRRVRLRLQRRDRRASTSSCPRAALGIDTANAAKPGFHAADGELRGHHDSHPATGTSPTTRCRSPWASATSSGAGSPAASACRSTPRWRSSAFDEATRIVTFRILINDNCGFRSLEPGLPDR